MVKNNIDRVFTRLKKQKRKALVAYLTAGYPTFKEFEKAVWVLEKGGASVLEIGIPFSDPVADGPTIQHSSQESLKKNTSLKKVLGWTHKIHKKITMPLVLMSYMNPILKYGLSKFASDASTSGISGLIIPDLIPEEGKPIQSALAKKGLYMIYLLAPTTPPHRQKSIANQTKGFLYAVSLTGVTGARKKTSSHTKQWLKRLSKLTQRPVCVGFGISNPQQIRQLKESVDGFIVGSAFIDLIRKNPKRKMTRAMSRFVSQLTKECNNGS